MARSAFFLHYAPHSHFEQGIFTPFATQKEAERQAAWDLLHGTDPDYILGVFREKLLVPKFGWTPQQAADAKLPHLDVKRRSYLLDGKALAKKAPKHLDDLVAEAMKDHAEWIRGVHQAIRAGSAFKANEPGASWTVMTGGTATGGAAALAAATAKTLVQVTAGTSDQPVIVEIGISFDGVTSSAVPVLVELVSGTATTTGTSTAQTPKQTRGWPNQTPISTCQQTFTVEPTVQLVNKKWLVTPNGGLFVIQFPLGREPTGIITATTDAKTWSIRATAPATVNAHAYLEFEE